MFIGATAVLFGLLGGCRVPAADDLPRGKGEAPPDQVIVSAGLGGSDFVPRPLKEKYDKLASAIRALEAEMNTSEPEGPLAQATSQPASTRSPAMTERPETTAAPAT